MPPAAARSIADVPVALLAGGLATRLRPITQTVPKAMVEVAGRPFVDHQLELLHRNGVRNVVFCLGYLGEQVEAYLGDGSRFGMNLRYSYDGETLLGTGGAIRRALPLLDGDLSWIMYGDSYMDIDYADVLATFQRHSVLGLMTVLENGDRWDGSNVIFREGTLLRYDKRKKTPEMTYIDYGVSILRRSAIERITPQRNYDLADVYSDLVGSGSMIGYEVTQRFYEIGTPTAMQEASEFLQSKTRSVGGS